MTDLILASQSGDERAVQRLLVAGANTNAPDQYGSIPLHYAIVYGHEAIVQLLLAAGANPNVANHVGRTPLHTAVSNGDGVIVPLLLAAGANPNSADRSGFTPLHTAAYYGLEAIVQLLLAAGADPTLRDVDNNTPSQIAKTSELRTLLTDAEYVWTHSWNPEEHPRWTEAQRLERVGALSAFRSGVRHVSVPTGTDTGRRIVIPELPREFQFAVFEHL